MALFMTGKYEYFEIAKNRRTLRYRHIRLIDKIDLID